MKKFALLSLVLLLTAVLFTSVFADAELTITDSTLFIYDDDDDGYFFARVENTGDAGGYVGSGHLMIYDDTGEAIIDKKYVSPSPSSIWLEPGEYAYVRYSIWDKILLEKKAVNFEYTIEGNKYGSKYQTIPCDVELYYPGGESWDNTLFVTFTNNSDTLLHNFKITAAFNDTDGKLTYVADRSYSDIAIHPGSTVSFSLTISSDFCKHLDKYGITPDRLDAFVYLEED